MSVIFSWGTCDFKINARSQLLPCILFRVNSIHLSWFSCVQTDYKINRRHLCQYICFSRNGLAFPKQSMYLPNLLTIGLEIPSKLKPLQPLLKKTKDAYSGISVVVGIHFKHSHKCVFEYSNKRDSQPVITISIMVKVMWESNK